MTVHDDDDDSGGIPEWVVTFGDMMSLMLTFFIMLVSLSEIKEEEEYQALIESIQRQLGHTTAVESMSPGKVRPRNSPVQKLTSQGRSKRLDTMRGGQRVKAPVGEHARVEIVQQGSRTVIGTTLSFPEGALELPPEELATLREQSRLFQGKPQRIEIRAHTSRRPVDPSETVQDLWDLAYERCRVTMKYLVEEMGVDPERIRLSVAGPNEPVYTGTDPEQLTRNPRVQVFELNEVVTDPDGR